MNVRRVPIILAFSVAASMRPAAADVNIVPNAGYEEAGTASAAAAWEPLTKGVPASFQLDEQITHTGKRSCRIEARDVTRAYVRSAAIPVAPGEILHVSAWARIRDVPADKGTVIVIAEFINTRGGPAGELKKVAVAEPFEDWQQLRGDVAVPAQAADLRLRLGLSYTKGTVWWDDVRVEPSASVVARADVAEDRWYPAAGSVPVVLLNRTGHRGTVQVRLALGQETGTAAVELTGERTQAAPVPLRARQRGKVVLRVEVRDGSKDGVGLFSSPPLAMTIPPPLTLMPLIPTHGVVEDGPGPLECEAEIALDAGAPQSNRIALRIIDARGQARASRELDNVTPSGVCRCELRPPALEEGAYTVRLELASPPGTVLTAEQPWRVVGRRRARTVLNAGGFPEHDGQAIFPLGMFNNSGRIEESAASGFNIVHTYNAARVRPGSRPDDQRLKNLLDRTEASGMHCLLLVPMEYAFVGDWEAFRRRIRMFRNHPALLAWDEEEGIARGDMNRSTLARIRAILNEEDPYHPLMVGDSRDVIGSVTDRSRFFPTDLMDLGMWWWYPLPLRSGSDDALQGEQAAVGAALEPPAFLALRNMDKPIWVGLQAYKKPGAAGRYPTPAEYRAQAYLAIIHGAKGLLWYGGSVGGGVFLDPEQGRWDELKRLAGELREASPVLMAPLLEAPDVAPADAPISAAIKVTPTGRLLLTASRSLEACEARFSVPGLRDNSVPVRGENRNVPAVNGVIRDRFGPLAVHVYELPGS